MLSQFGLFQNISKTLPQFNTHIYIYIYIYILEMCNTPKHSILYCKYHNTLLAPQYKYQYNAYKMWRNGCSIRDGITCNLVASLEKQTGHSNVSMHPKAKTVSLCQMKILIILIQVDVTVQRYWNLHLINTGWEQYQLS